MNVTERPDSLVLHTHLDDIHVVEIRPKKQIIPSAAAGS